MLMRIRQVAGIREAGLLIAAAVLAGCALLPNQPGGFSETVEPSMYQIAVLGSVPGETVQVSQAGHEIWRFEAWMATVMAQGDLTGDGIDNLLISYAEARSLRGYRLVALGPAGVEVLWDVQGHVERMREVESDIAARLESGRTLAPRPGMALPR